MNIQDPYTMSNPTTVEKMTVLPLWRFDMLPAEVSMKKPPTANRRPASASTMGRPPLNAEGTSRKVMMLCTSSKRAHRPQGGWPGPPQGTRDWASAERGAEAIYSRAKRNKNRKRGIFH